MKKNIYQILCVVCVLFSAPNLYAPQNPMCPTSNCTERLVTADDDYGTDDGSERRDGNLRDVLTHACEDDGDDAIQFGFYTTIEMLNPMTIRADCKGRIFIYGRPTSRAVISGGGARAPNGDGPNCLIRVESNGNLFSRLNVIDYASSGDRAASPGIGICLIGNDNTVLDSTFGVIDAGNYARPNDVGILAGGSANQIINNHISQNKLDGIQISGNNNRVAGNYLGISLENCDFAETGEPPSGGPPEDNTAGDDGGEAAANEDLGPAPTGRGVADETPPVGGYELIVPVTKSVLTGECPLVSNERHGIHLFGDARDNVIGGPGENEENVIQYNGGSGIRLSGTALSVSNLLSPNVFNMNKGLGIDLASEGVTADDDGDVDAGPNTILNRPEILFVNVRNRYAGSNNIRSVLYGRGVSGNTIHLYAADSARLEGLAQGMRYLRELNIPRGEEQFTADLGGLSLGTPLVALAIDPSNNTSEFSFVDVIELDSDMDGLPDQIEDGNANGIVDGDETDPYDPDSDGDGLVDSVEDANKNGGQDQAETAGFSRDSDNDGISDFVETHGDGAYDPQNGDTDPLSADTDGDGLTDGEEDANHNGIVEFYLSETLPLVGN